VTSFVQASRADLQRYLGGEAASLSSILATIRRNEGLQAILVYRFGRLLDSKKELVLLWPLLSMGWCIYGLAALFVRRGYGIKLALSANIGAGFWVGHFGGIEVFNCRLAERCSVGQQTKVGGATQRDGPIIEDSVWIGAHASIAGPVRVRSRATIAPGARVTKNVPGRALVVGAPARVVAREYDNSRILPGL
jgi:serine O-acetyltransferase